MKKHRKLAVGIFLILALLVGSLIAATIKQPKIQLDIGDIDLSAGRGEQQTTAAGAVYQSKLKQYTGLSFNNAGVQELLQEAVDAYIAGTVSIEAVNELVAAVILDKLKNDYNQGLIQAQPVIGTVQSGTGSSLSALMGFNGGSYNWRAYRSSRNQPWYQGGGTGDFVVGPNGTVVGRVGAGGKVYNSSGSVIGKVTAGGKVVGNAPPPSISGYSVSQAGTGGEFGNYDIVGLSTNIKTVAARGSYTWHEFSDITTESVDMEDIFVNTLNQGMFEVDLSGTGEYTVATATMGTYVNGTPIVLDMDGDGKIAASQGKWLPHPGQVDTKNLRFFDFNANSFEVITEWVGKGDGLLCEPNEDGSVDGTCLFGSPGGYENGFDELSLRDADKNYQLTGSELNGLFVWLDDNSNARAEKEELISLPKAGITQISLDQNNFAGSFVRNGKKQTMWDWWPNCLSVMKVAVKKID